MNKQLFHITPSGHVGRCRAKKQCPYGDRPHFETKSEADDFQQAEYTSVYGITANHKRNYTRVEDALDDPNSMTRAIKDTVDARTRGFEYECFGTSMYASDLGLNKALVFNSSGIHAIHSDDTMEELAPVFSRALGSLSDFYEERGIQVRPEALIRAAFYGDNSDDIVVLSGSPETLDAHLIKPDGAVVGIEIKKTHGTGAQLSSIVLDTNTYGQVLLGDNEEISPELAQAITQSSTYQTDGTNKPMKVSDEVAMEHFVRQYQEKGVEMLVHTNHAGLVVYQDIKGSPSEVASRLLNKGMRAEVVLRMNYAPVNMYTGDTQADKSRVEQFNNTSFDYMAANVDYDHGSFTLGDVFRKELTKTGGDNGYARMGQYILPIKHKDLRDAPDDLVINIADLKYYPVTLTGTIKNLI